MPACPRKDVFDPDNVGVYHCHSRCVRRAFLCGRDRYTGNDFSHRKEWLERRLEFLASLMALDVLGHAVMDNHHHVVLRNRPDLVQSWSDHEVARRWLTLSPGQRILDNEIIEPTDVQIEALVANRVKLAEVRKRLSDISWFMKFYKEAISRRGNAEDECRGAFWESRFKCTRLLDPFAILLGVMYVDLNSIRAQIVSTPEDSEYTSISLRIRARQARAMQQAGQDEGDSSCRELLAAAWLAPIDESRPPPDGPQAQQGRRASDHGFLTMTLEKYLEFVDWSGRQLHADKRGAIPSHLAPVLERLQVDLDYYLAGLQQFQGWFANFAGRAQTLVEHARKSGRSWIRGVGRAGP